MSGYGYRVTFGIAKRALGRWAFPRCANVTYTTNINYVHKNIKELSRLFVAT